MNKSECELFLEKLLDTEDPDRAAALLNDPHASGCSDCLEQVKQFAQLLKTVSGVPLVAPPVSIRQHFYQALHQEMGVAKPPATIRRISFGWVAAACLLLVAGAATVYQFMGRNVSRVETGTSARVAIEPVLPVISVAERVNGISTATEEQPEDPKLVATLLNILERDKNPHVRMAAFYGLTKYKAMNEVHNRLVSVLQSEQDPMMQVLLINFLTETKEPRALDAVRAIITNKKTRKEVKTLALSKI
jgi:hypothetical protein